jgi:hypothetical protein
MAMIASAPLRPNHRLARECMSMTAIPINTNPSTNIDKRHPSVNN